ncbi:MAG: SpoIID/LytB domain-containing protein [Planctomycetota bacterium]
MFLFGLVLLAVLFNGCERRMTVRPTPQMDVESQFWVRVLLLSGVTEGTLGAPAPLRIAPTSLGQAPPGPAATTAELPGATKLTLTDGRLRLGNTALPGRDVTLTPARPHVFALNGRQYRGRLQVVLSADGQTFDAVNWVPLEPYLAGVVGAEMPDYWEPEALKAQAVAARTYCLYIKHRFGIGRHWDVSRTQASQVYHGVEDESAPVWSAVNGTRGQVLATTPRSGSHPTIAVGRAALFPAYYSSSCGGHTEDSAKVFGDSFAPLAGAPCPYCRDVARLGVFYWPLAQFDNATVTERLGRRYPKLKALGEVANIEAIETRDYEAFSRLTRIRVTGANGRSDTLRAEDLRLTIDPAGRQIKSTICQIVRWGDGWAFLSGRGWGHGVGLCQCGAEGMARLGKSAGEILEHYYPGAWLVKIY